MKFMKLFVAVLTVVGLAGVAAAAPKVKSDTRDLGGAPIGRVEELAPFAVGNLTVTDFNRPTETLILRVSTASNTQLVRLRLGKTFILKLKAGNGVLVYWKYRYHEDSGYPTAVLLVLQPL